MELKHMIRAAGITQRELATRIGASEPAVSKMVAGKQTMTAETALRIADALAVDPADVLRAVVASPAP
jgi:plasmid maintenance system antidote protein VapI